MIQSDNHVTNLTQSKKVKVLTAKLASLTPVLSSPEMDTRWKYGVKASAAEDAAADAVTPAAE